MAMYWISEIYSHNDHFYHNKIVGDNNAYDYTISNVLGSIDSGNWYINNLIIMVVTGLWTLKAKEPPCLSPGTIIKGNIIYSFRNTGILHISLMGQLFQVTLYKLILFVSLSIPGKLPNLGLDMI